VGYYQFAFLISIENYHHQKYEILEYQNKSIFANQGQPSPVLRATTPLRKTESQETLLEPRVMKGVTVLIRMSMGGRKDREVESKNLLNYRTYGSGSSIPRVCLHLHVLQLSPNP
jgi:hypothetical protein